MEIYRDSLDSLPESMGHWLDRQADRLPGERQIAVKVMMASLAMLKSMNLREQTWTLDKMISRVGKYLKRFEGTGLSNVPDDFLDFASRQVLIELSERGLATTDMGTNVDTKNIETANIIVRLPDKELEDYENFLQTLSQFTAVNTHKE